jgi:hypothetical protein
MARLVGIDHFADTAGMMRLVSCQALFARLKDPAWLRQAFHGFGDHEGFSHQFVTAGLDLATCRALC